jgi:hypothetical protein
MAGRPYARASNSLSTVEASGRSPARSELGALRRLMNDVAKYHRQGEWRQAVQRRSTTISRSIRLIMRALGQNCSGRKRQGARWHFFGCFGGVVTPVVALRLPPSRTLQDLARPPVIEILTPDLLGDTTIDRLRKVLPFIEQDDAE